MNITKLKTLIEMSLNKEVIRHLLKIHKILKEDKKFNIVKYIKLLYNMQKGEKIIKFNNQYIISTFLPPFPSEAFYTNLMAVAENKNIFTQQAYAKRSGPISCYLSLTHKCPNNCVYCSAKNRKDEAELTTQDWKTIIKDLQEMKTCIIGLTGGEPLIREDILEIVQTIDQRSTAILFTSGYNLTYKKAKELKENGLFGIGISLDSHDKEIHNRNRNDKNAFDFALKAIKNANRAGLYTFAQTVILKDHIHEEAMFKLFALAKKHGAHEVKVLEPILSGSLLDEKNLDEILYDSASRAKLIKIQHKANKRKDLPKITSFAYTESASKFGCGAGTQHSYVSAVGDLYPCDFVPMSFGKVQNKGVKIAWKEMNDTIGIPKIECFAQKINKQVYKQSQGKLPLHMKEAKEICSKHKSKHFPQYYRSLQEWF